VARLQDAVADGQISLDTEAKAEVEPFEEEVFRANQDTGILALNIAKNVFLTERGRMLQSQRPKATQEEIKQISDSDWRKSSMEKRQIYVDRWAGKAGPHETNTVSSAMEDGLELGIWGSENWRNNMIDELSRAMLSPAYYSLTKSSGQLQYDNTDWMTPGELLWVSTPPNGQWWPAKIAAEPPKLPVPGAAAEPDSKKKAEPKEENKEEIWVLLLHHSMHKEAMKVPRTSAMVLPFRTCHAKLSKMQPPDPKLTEQWTSALQTAEEAEEDSLVDLVDQKVEKYISRKKDFHPEPVAQRHLTSFVRSRAQHLLEALLHEYLGNNPHLDITDEEKKAQEEEEQEHLRDALQKVLELATKELFVYLHANCDEHSQGDLMNLWSRLSHTEKGMLTSKQVSGVLMQLLDSNKELACKAVDHFVQNRVANSPSPSTKVPTAVKSPEQVGDTPTRARAQLPMDSPGDAAQKQITDQKQAVRHHHDKIVDTQRQLEIQSRLRHQNTDFTQMFTVRNYQVLSQFQPQPSKLDWCH